jgi:hypothetical protein
MNPVLDVFVIVLCLAGLLAWRVGWLLWHQRGYRVISEEDADMAPRKENA